ncbi:MAG: carboxypeptidase M32 [Alphaproteobacteria bacterium]|nr:carboxypeptidase M32 [Alphaproteobacteria bacterium]
MTAYQTLESKFKRLAGIDGALSVLHWDSATMMPDGGAETRAEQLATLAAIRHECLVDPSIPELAAKAVDEVDIADHWRRANVREMLRQWRHANAVPPELVERRSRANSACEMAWRSARSRSDFAAVAPLLTDVVAVAIDVAAIKAQALGCTPYDALLDSYDPDLRSAEVDRIFADLASFLPGFLDRVLAKQGREPAGVLPPGPFPVEAQRALADRLIDALGFDRRHGRLDSSHHPFTGGVPADVRITTRYDVANFIRSLMAVIHETGHALYEMGLPVAWRDQPAGGSRGMTLHESQSLLMEMHACRSSEFLGYLAPQACAVFGGKGPTWEPTNLRRVYLKVERGLIRVDADEVTYPLHVILRYDLERALLDGSLKVVDLPGAWREGMKRLVGIAPPDDKDGCMQDIHWYGGDFGYFPTYTLGALAAAQLFAAAKEADPTIPSAIGRGDFAPLVSWLRANVHGVASRLSTQEILVAATKEPIGTEAFKRHITARYLDG